MDVSEGNPMCSCNKSNRAVTILLAEFIGTGLLVFISCMANAIMMVTQHPVHLEKAVATGMAVAIVIQIFGHISEAHLNPAVTLAAVVLGKVDLCLALVYIAAECSGATAGYALTEALVPSSMKGCGLCVTSVSQDVSLMQAVVLEASATFILVLVVAATWDRRNCHQQDSAPLKFGFLITTLCILLDPFTGASMNPARSLGPAIYTNCWNYHWVYWTGPITGSLVSSTTYKFVFGRTPITHQKIEDQTLGDQKFGSKDSANEESSCLDNATASNFCVKENNMLQQITV